MQKILMSAIIEKNILCLLELMECVLSIFSAYFISKLTGYEFRFYWPHNEILNIEYHSVETVDKIFSKDFIEKYYIEGMPPKNLKSMQFIKGDEELLSAHFRNSIAKDECLVPPFVILDYLNIDENRRKEYRNNILNGVEFSENIKFAQRLAKNVCIPQNNTAIHIRSGDLVYGLFAENPIYTAKKAICAPIVLNIVKELDKINTKSILFGQEPETIRKIANSFDAIDASSFLSEDFSKSQKAIFDVMLISRCDSIFSISSVFTTFARFFSNIKLKSIFTLHTKKEYTDIILDEISMNSDFFNEYQKAYSMFLAYNYVYDIDEFNRLEYLISQAIKFNPSNLMYKFLQAITYYKYNEVTKAEHCLENLFYNVQLDNFINFKKSSFIKMISFHSNIRYAFDQYEPFNSIYYNCLPYSKLICNFFANKDLNGRIVELYENLKKTRKLAVNCLHTQSFKVYKNIYYGKDIVLIATGPSLNYFTVPIKNAIYVGVNKAFLYEKITLDYLFIQDYSATKEYIEKSINYKNSNLKRFYGKRYGANWSVPDELAKKHKAAQYFHFGLNKVPFALDITFDYLADFASVVSSALQFILFTNPKKLYIVGCDCKAIGHFDTNRVKGNESTYETVKDGWRKFKEFAQIHYPNIQIISINPIGLKGLFKDEIYTDTFLKEYKQ
ncbi:MAG: hypothetical protein LBD84_00890 [Campylobacteraceae bacterium]|nr:hypothetical protein [Campylobacteraceae bacterium]